MILTGGYGIFSGKKDDFFVGASNFVKDDFKIASETKGINVGIHVV